MIKKAYMLQGSYGRFGLTKAMFRRCDEFIKRGIHCVSLTVDFTQNIYTIEAEAKATNSAPIALEFRNPYLDLSIQADTWSNDVGIHIAKNFLLSYIEDNTIVYYQTNGYKLNQKKYSLADRLSYIESNDIIISESYLHNDIKVEFNYSLKGLCISIREFDYKSNKQLRCLVFDYSLGIIKYYKSSYQWNISWMKGLFPIDDNVALICDGPGSARKIVEAKRDKVKVMYVMHNNHKHDNGNIVKRDKWNLENKNKFDAIIALTERHKEDLINDFGGGNFYNILNFTKMQKLDFETAYQPMKIGFFGQLIDRKGVNDAIKALALIHEKYSLPATLHFFGGAPNPEDLDKNIAKYMRTVKEKKLEKFVTFHGYTTKAFQEMSLCHCILFPSYSEAQPLTIVEVMSLGIPIISYDCKYGPSTMIEDGKSGYLSEVGNIEQLAKNASDILTNDVLRAKVSKSAKERAQQFTDSDYVFQQWNKIFAKLF